MAVLSDSTMGRTRIESSRGTSLSSVYGNRLMQVFRGNKSQIIDTRKVSLWDPTTRNSISMNDGRFSFTLRDGTSVALSRESTASLFGRYTHKAADVANAFRTPDGNPDPTLKYFYTSHRLDHVENVVALVKHVVDIRGEYVSPRAEVLATLGALYHDAGMTNFHGMFGGVYVGGLTAVAKECRSNHSMVSGLEVIKHREDLSAELRGAGLSPMDFYSLSLVSAAHSKSGSGLKAFTKEDLCKFAERFGFFCRDKSDFISENFGKAEIEFDVSYVLSRIENDPEYVADMFMAMDVVAEADSFTHSENFGDVLSSQGGLEIGYVRDFLSRERLFPDYDFSPIVPREAAQYSELSEFHFFARNPTTGETVLIPEYDDNVYGKGVWIGEANVRYEPVLWTPEEKVYTFHTKNDDVVPVSVSNACLDRIAEFPRVNFTGSPDGPWKPAHVTIQMDCAGGGVALKERMEDSGVGNQKIDDMLRYASEGRLSMKW